MIDATVEQQGEPKRRKSIQKYLKPRKAVAVAAAVAVKPQPTLKWALWMCVQVSEKNYEAKGRCEGGQ